LAATQTNRDTHGHGRGQRTVTAAEKSQAREVSLRRIGRLFGPYRWPLAVVTAIIVASSLVGLASPFLLRAIIDTALPEKNVQLLAWLVLAMVAVACSKQAGAKEGGAVTVQEGPGNAFSFSPSTVTVTKGRTITLDNVSNVPHTFTVTGQGIDLETQPGKTSTVTINLPPGTYPFICRFHVSLGMKGTLVVR